MTVHSLYGVRLASDFPFANRLPLTSGPADLVFEEAGTKDQRIVTDLPEATYESPYRLEDGRPQLSVHALPSADVFTLTGVVRFLITSERIAYELLDRRSPYVVEILLLGTVFSLWLERRGLPALHAAAVIISGEAVGFLASNMAGKSSLAASLMQLGYPLLTDDILPIEATPEDFLGRPGYPQMRMWPDQAAYFMESIEGLELVHPLLEKRRVPVGVGGLGCFHAESAPLARLYLLERGASNNIEVVPLSFGEALMALVRNSFLLGIPEALGLSAARFRLFAALVRRVPVYRLRYPDGALQLLEVRAAILDGF